MSIHLTELRLTNLFPVISNKTVPLGPWVDSNERDYKFKRLFQTEEELEENSLYLIDLLARVVSFAGKNLNDYHQIEFGQQSWHILCAPWAVEFLQMSFLHFKYLQPFLDQECLVQVLSVEGSSPFKSTREIWRSFHGDFGHHYILSLIIDFLRPKKWTIKTHDNLKQYIETYGVLIDLSREVKLKAKRIALALLQRQNAVFIEGIPGMTWKEVKKIAGSVVNGHQLNTIPVKILNEKMIKEEIHNEFETFVFAYLFKTMPTFLVKGFKLRTRLADLFFDFYGKNWKLLTVGPLLGGYDPMKFLAASFVDRGGKIAIFQHGCSYGYLRTFTSMPGIEYLGSHYFLSWGWKRHGHYPVKTVPVPVPSFSKQYSVIKRDNRIIDRPKIIFVGTMMLRYPDRLSSVPHPEDWDEYAKMKLDFLAAIGTDLIDQVLYRAYPNTHGCIDEQAYIKKFYSKVTFLGNNWKKSLSKNTLVVVDHPGTTFLETLTSGIPTIGFWNKNVWQINEDAQPFFDNLSRQPLVFNSGHDAGDFINKTYFNLHAWWNDERSESTRNEFISHYSKRDIDWENSWGQAMNSCLH